MSNIELDVYKRQALYGQHELNRVCSDILICCVSLVNSCDPYLTNALSPKSANILSQEPGMLVTLHTLETNMIIVTYILLPAKIANKVRTKITR